MRLEFYCTHNFYIFGGHISLLFERAIKVVLQGSPRSPDIQNLSECHRLYDWGRHTEQPSPSYLADVDISPNPNTFNFWTSESEYIKKTGIRIHFFQNWRNPWIQYILFFFAIEYEYNYPSCPGEIWTSAHSYQFNSLKDVWYSKAQKMLKFTFNPYTAIPHNSRLANIKKGAY